MRHIGSRRELFVDDWLIEEVHDLRLMLQQPAVKEVALEFDAPWEGPTSGYVTVFHDEECYRMYYRGASEQADSEITAYAESADGINWTKPSLGTVAHERWPDNNIILTGDGTHNFVPFFDRNPLARPEHRYKALGSCPRFRRPGAPREGALLPFTSANALEWQLMIDAPALSDGAFDSQNVVFWDQLRGMYVAYVRDWRHGYRTIRRSVSQDFRHWSIPEWVDFGDTPEEDLYTSAICPYFRAPHIYLGFPMRFVPQRHLIRSHREQGVSDCVFMSSRDGLHWDRRFMEAFVRPGLDPANWTDRNIQMAYGVVPTGKDELSLYWLEHYRHESCRLRRGVLRLDGFVSLHGQYRGGEMITKPFTFTGEELVVNFSTSAVGSLRVEAQDLNRAPIPGFELSPELFGDSIEQQIRWPNNPNLKAWAGKPVRLRFVLRDADLYSFQFR